jgi:hypothetical protein
MPFRHPDRSHDLDTRIDMEIRERLEEAIDFVCLEALVRGRRAAGRPAPAADNADDRAEYHAHVGAFLLLLAKELRSSEPPRARPPSGDDDDGRLLGAQVVLARAMPDYWQQFEMLSARYLAEPLPSGGQRGRLLARLFGRA